MVLRGEAGWGQAAPPPRAFLLSWLQEGTTQPFREGEARHGEYASTRGPLC